MGRRKNTDSAQNSIFAGVSRNVNDSANVATSRLLENSNNLRNTLNSRNLYNPDRQYPIQSDSNASRIINAVSSVIEVVTPFKSYNLKNTVYGRLITDSTPLTEIGLIMLGKQFAMNSMSRVAQQTFPVIKPTNLFDNNPKTKLFTRNINYGITKKEEIKGFQQFLDRVIYYYPAKDYPFNKNASNSDFIKNTGQGQLSFLYSNINKNIYIQDDDILKEFGDLNPRTNIIQPNHFFNFDDKKQNPYSLIPADSRFWAIDANQAMWDAYSVLSNEIFEYAPNQEFIIDNFGKLDKTPIAEKEGLSYSADKDINNWVDKDTGLGDDYLQNKVIWGLNGATEDTIKNLNELRSGESPDAINSGVQQNNLKTDFNIKAGLLEYTRNLINAKGGDVGDITRKAFKSGDKLVGFNGSALWTAPSTALQEFAGRKGVRQHSILDQYDRFAKAIRFNGNQVYGGNEDSVIYKSVIPRIHPTIDEGEMNNKNLIFSIENLAVTVKNETNEPYGTLDDEYNTPIPACEIGQSGGRLMWFPPYNLKINETANAKFEPTVMVGRNEPIYNYMHSERSATLTFTLLIDYPEQLKNYVGQDKHKAIAEFFAFGGDDYNKTLEDVSEAIAKIPENEKRIQEVEGRPPFEQPEIEEPAEIIISFPNDVPNVKENLNTFIDKLYKEYTYEIIDGLLSSDGKSFGLNEKIFIPSGVTKITGTPFYFLETSGLAGFSQYNQTGSTVLNDELRRIYDTEENRRLFDIEIEGRASKLFLVPEREREFNRLLGLRRANVAKFFINERLKAIYGKDAAGLGITIKFLGENNSGTSGSLKADPKNATVDRIPERETKEERVAIIKIKKNSNEREKPEVVLTEEERKVVDALKQENDNLKKKINNSKLRSGTCIYNERKSTSGGNSGDGNEDNNNVDAGILKGFKSVSGDYFYPTFHSQTPEDFHKRLTFLHQCTRQGTAKRYEVQIDDTGTPRARNSVFGKQPICILRIGDFFFTKIIIENVQFDYNDTIWDLNPEGFGMQPMIANITLQIKIMGGQSLKGPIDALQNAVSFNYYANSTFSKDGTYKTPSKVASIQYSKKEGVSTDESISDEKNRNNSK